MRQTANIGAEEEADRDETLQPSSVQYAPSRTRSLHRLKKKKARKRSIYLSATHYTGERGLILKKEILVLLLKYFAKPLRAFQISETIANSGKSADVFFIIIIIASHLGSLLRMCQFPTASSMVCSLRQFFFSFREA